MDDQFNGRTDDDLFADDFEPVATQASEEEVPAVTRDAPPTQTTISTSQPVKQAIKQAPEPAVTAAPSKPPPRSLAKSRHNDARPTDPVPSQPQNQRQRPPRQQDQQQQHAKPAAKPAAKSTAKPTAKPTTTPTAKPTTTPAEGAESSGNAPLPAPAPSTAPAGPNTNPSAARLGSGANPRTKLTAEELNAKMKAMRLASAEKTKKFEEAQQDERSHSIAYERGMEEARKRRQAEDQQRKRGEEDRRRMEDERARNRERKLKAMGQKEGGWDEGKEEREGEERRRGGILRGVSFRGAYGGVRGAANHNTSGKFALERFLADVDSPPDFGVVHAPPPIEGLQEPGQPEPRGSGDRARGRGRGGHGRGRGGRGGFNDSNGDSRAGRHGDPSKAPGQGRLSKDEFPALPPGAKDTPKGTEKPKVVAIPVPGVKKIETKAPAPLEALPTPFSPITGGWDEEVAANDAQKAAGTS